MGRAMDEESGRERILPRAQGVFPQRKAGSKGCRETSAEARLPEGGITGWSLKESLSPLGQGLRTKLGVGLGEEVAKGKNLFYRL